MTKIQNINNVYANQKNEILNADSKRTTQTTPQKIKTTSVQDEFVKQHKKNGIFERLFNSLKNITGLGIGSKKAKEAIKKAEQGKITKEEALNVVNKYRKSQSTSEQAFGDILSVGAAGMTFFGVRNFGKMQAAKVIINEKNIKNFLNNLDLPKQLGPAVLKLSKNNKAIAGITTGIAALAGATTKYFGLKFNRVGSDEFKINKKDYNGAKTIEDKAQYKKDKKALKKERRKANFRNYVSGAINGLMMPLTLVGGAIVGIPSYFIGNSINRYAIGNHEDKKKSFKGYVDNLVNNPVSHLAVVAATAAPMVKKAQFTKVFDKNLNKVVNSLKDANLQEHNFNDKSTYQELDNILMNSYNIWDIIYSYKMTAAEQIKKLTDENIFAVKFKQISNDGSKLAKELRENCPPTRSLEEAKKYISKNLGDGYEVTKLLGVGTVAETYLAKSPDGKEVCIKILKDGINKDKILTDKQKFIDIINKLSDKTQEEKDYLLKNVDDLAEGILKEVDFANEMKAAQKLAETTRIANVVKPIEIKNGVYVMEKANGISLSSLVELNSAKIYKDILVKNPALDEILEPLSSGKLYELIQPAKTNDEKIKIIDNYIKQIESRTPEFGDISLSKDDFKALITEYEAVLVEQFNKVDKNGKVLHADIHPGNIFIDIKALRNRQKGIINDVQGQLGKYQGNKIFTLIDTGNTIDMGINQSLRAINLTSYIQNGNIKDIAEYVLDGASLGNKTKEEALKILEKELKTIFFDNKTALDTVTNENLLTLTSNIMKKNGITPADTQLNLNKAKQSSQNSLNELINSLGIFYYKELINTMKNIDTNTPKGMAEATLKHTIMGTQIAKDFSLLYNQSKRMASTQENLNLLQLSPEQILKQKNNPNMLKTNSEEYLTYKLKQAKLSEKLNPFD